MKDKINIAELLKDCPKGMELDCTMYDNLYFDSLNADYYGTINCYTLIDGIKTSINFTKYGTFNNHIGAKCVIFPKGKTTWEGFTPPCQFKDGDVIVCENHWGPFISIFKENVTERNGFIGYCVLDVNDNEFKIKDSASYFNEARFATKREKEQLFRAIGRNGYKWNEKTKTLEKLIQPKFKVGDRIRHKCPEFRGERIISSCGKDGYWTSISDWIGYKCQDDWELVSDKFDITTLKPFDKVLARDTHRQIWIADYFSHNIKEHFGGYRFACIGHCWCQCIPYEGNEHLLGTTNDCDERFKSWE